MKHILEGNLKNAPHNVFLSMEHGVTERFIHAHSAKVITVSVKIVYGQITFMGQANMPC